MTPSDLTSVSYYSALNRHTVLEQWVLQPCFWILSLHMGVSGFASASTCSYLQVLPLLWGGSRVFIMGPMEVTSHQCFLLYQSLHVKLSQVASQEHLLVCVCILSLWTCTWKPLCKRATYTRYVETYLGKMVLLRITVP